MDDHKAPLRNIPELELKFPQPAARPGQAPDFSHLHIPAAGAIRMPDIGAPTGELHDLAYGLIRVLDDEGCARQPWDPHLDADTLRWCLRTMMVTRSYDEHMFRAQRQGKTSFYVKCRGEEAIGVAQALALQSDDACFPHYRTHGLLIARGYPIEKMMAQVYSNARDPLKGRNMPCLYSSKEFNYVTHSANLGTQFSQAVGWAMASALSKDRRIAAAWIGEGATAEGDFHYALTFAAAYRVPVLLNIINNQWAISSYHGVAGGENAPFAARGIGYGIPALRVDGNDLLAVYAATRWAADRARLNLGPTLLELFTYRADAHSTSDDPSRYRPVDEASKWPLGDPIERLKDHLLTIGEWSPAQHEELWRKINEDMRATQRDVEAVGTLFTGEKPPVSSMFEDVFKEPDWRYRRQRQQFGL